MSSPLINRIELQLSSVSTEAKGLGSAHIVKKEESRFLYENHEDNPNEGEVTVHFDDCLRLRFILSSAAGRSNNPTIELGDVSTIYRISIAQLLELLRREYGPDGS